MEGRGEEFEGMGRDWKRGRVGEGGKVREEGKCMEEIKILGGRERCEREEQLGRKPRRPKPYGVQAIAVQSATETKFGRQA